MPSARVRLLEHTVSVAAPAGVVYGILADAAHWPVLLTPYIHVERVDFDGVEELLHLWDETDGRIRTTHARRALHPQAGTIRFEQENTARRGERTTGTWTVRAAGDERSLLSLRLDDNPAPLTHTGPGPTGDEAPRELLEQVRRAAERWTRLDELLLSFEESAWVDGPGELVYDFLYRVDDWPELLPHVEQVDLVEDRPGIQVAALDTCASDDGRTRSTRTVRLCFPYAGRIVYKDTTSPDPIAAHTGEWSLTPEDSGTRVVCAHRVLLREDAVETAPGEGTSLPETRRQVRELLGRGSREALDLARWHAGRAVRRLR